MKNEKKFELVCWRIDQNEKIFQAREFFSLSVRRSKLEALKNDANKHINMHKLILKKS